MKINEQAFRSLQPLWFQHPQSKCLKAQIITCKLEAAASEYADRLGNFRVMVKPPLQAMILTYSNRQFKKQGR